MQGIVRNQPPLLPAHRRGSDPVTWRQSTSNQWSVRYNETTNTGAFTWSI